MISLYRFRRFPESPKITKAHLLPSIKWANFLTKAGIFRCMKSCRKKSIELFNNIGFRYEHLRICYKKEMAQYFPKILGHLYIFKYYYFSKPLFILQICIRCNYYFTGHLNAKLSGHKPN